MALSFDSKSPDTDGFPRLQAPLQQAEALSKLFSARYHVSMPIGLHMGRGSLPLQRLSCEVSTYGLDDPDDGRLGEAEQVLP